MKKHWKKCLAFTLSLSLAFGAPAAALWSRMSFGAERPATVKATSLNIRSGPGTKNASVGKLSYGAAVTVVGEAAAADGSLWYQIRYTAGNGQTATGYVSSSYIQFPATYSSDANFEAYLNAQGFPESYRPVLRELHARYPQWVFTAMDTGLDWNEVIQNESLVGRNLVSRSSISSWKSTAPGAYDWSTGTWPGFDGSAWVAASEDIIRYYMDPRNFINETYIFQFLSQSYDASAQTREGLLTLVQGTFLSGSASTGGTYTGSTGTPTGGTGATDSGGSASGGGPGGSGYGPGYGSTSGGSSGSSAGNTSGSTSGGTLGRSPGSGGTGDEVVVGIPPGGDAADKRPAGGNTVGTGSGAAPGSSGGPGTVSGNGSSGSSLGKRDPNVTVGVPPGKDVSRAGDGFSGLSLSSSLHQVSRAGATVIQVGPGGQGSGQSSAPSGDTGSSGTASYVDILMRAAQESGVSPYVLASMILQEQGIQGKSESISGAGGYYNFYNFEAYASNGMTAVQRGLWYASQSGSYMRPWDSIDKSIIGGACQYGQNYVQAGQDTFYLKKFNVQGSNLYKHQYMTNVEAAAAEGAKMGTAYSETMRQLPLRFKIPVYRNMPAQASVKPVLDGSPNNKLSTMGVDGFTMSPSFNRDTESYDVSVNSSVTSVVLRASALDQTAQLSGAGTISLQGTVTEAKITVTAQNGSVRTYTVRITRSASGPQSNGSIADGGVGSAGGGSPSGSGTAPDGGTAGGGTSVTQGPGGGGDYSAGPGGAGGPAGGTAGSGSGSTGGPGGSNVPIVY